MNHYVMVHLKTHKMSIVKLHGDVISGNAASIREGNEYFLIDTNLPSMNLYWVIGNLSSY